MYLTNWSTAEYDYGVTVTVECITAPPAEDYTDKQQKTYVVGESYTAQWMMPFGPSWVVGLQHADGMLHGFSFSPEDFKRHFKITARHAASAA